MYCNRVDADACTARRNIINAMEITGRKNLELTKRAYQNHLAVLSRKALQADEDEARKIIDPEIDETNAMLDAIEINLKRIEDPEG